MATTIKLKNGSGAPTAGDLVQGEPAIDLTNKRLYTEDSGGSVIEVGSNPSSLSIAGTAVTATATELNTLDGITSTTAELNILDGVTSTAAELNILDGVTASTAELNILDGVTSTAAELNILDGVTSTTAELNILDGVTATAAELNVLDGVTAFVDEDDMSSDSATSIPSQQSVKAYVDAQLTASDLDFQGDSGGALSIDLDSETLTVAGGTGIDTSGATNTLTVAIDSTVTTLTGTQTLTNKTLTSPVISSISNTGTITLPTSTDTLVGRATTDTLTNKTLTSAVLNTGVSGTAVLDEDDMSSDSATQLATQQSIKAYVDSQVASADTLAELTDTNITTPADGALLFYDTTTSKWIDNVVSGDVTIADTGVAAIGSGVIVNDDINASAAISVSKTALTAGTGLTLTTDTLSVDASQTQITAVGTIGTGTWQGSVISDTYVANDLTISGGTIENTVIGAATPAAGTFTTFTSTGIDDNASSTAITISSAGETTFSGDVNLEESTPRILLQDSDVTDSRLQIAMAGATTYVRTRGGTSDYGDVRFQRNNDGSTHLNVFRTTAGGDVLFYDDDGSTEGMRWDSSVSRVGIGLSSPAKTIDMQSTAPSVRFRDNSATTTITDLLTSGANGHIFNMVLDAGNAGTSPSFIIKNYTSELFRFTGTGRLGIGESAPDEELHIKASVPTIKLEDGDGTDQDFRILENNGQASLIAQNGTSFGNIIFRRDNGTNLYSVLNLTSDGDVDFYDNTGSSIGMRWDASSKRLGIDGNVPSSLLQIGNASNENADAYITFGKRVASTETNLPFIGQDDPDGGGHNDLGIGVRSSNGTINFYTGNVAAFTAANRRMTIDSSGNVGIGATTIDTALHIEKANPVIQLEDSTNGFIAQIDGENGGLAFKADTAGASGSATNITFAIDGSERVRLDNSGNVGIGESAPIRTLHVNSGSTQVTSIFESTEANAYVDLANSATAQGRVRIGASGTDIFTIHTEGVERLRVASAGQIGIGGGNYGTSGQVLTSNGSGSAPSWQDASGGGGSGSGITEIDNWRLTADITANTDPISSNLERVDDASFAKLGTGMSVSSGIWTFPSTGLWEIGNYLVALLTATDSATIIRTYVSTNGGANWDESTTSRVGYGGASAWQAGNTVSYVNVTNTTNVKVKFTADSIASGNAIKGNTASSQTQFTFKRLGDSQ